MENSRLAVCIINYCNWSDTLQCIASLCKQQLSDGMQLDVVVIDNCSVDDSVAQIKEALRDKIDIWTIDNNRQFVCQRTLANATIHLIESPINGGFAYGNNICTLFARTLNATHQLWLNNDVEVPDDFCAKMLNSYMAQQKSLSMVGSDVRVPQKTLSMVESDVRVPQKTLSMVESDAVAGGSTVSNSVCGDNEGANGRNEECRLAMSAEERAFDTKKRRHTGFQYLHQLSGLTFAKKVFRCDQYLCGACLMVDIDAPLWNEEFFLYYEDADYAFLLKQAGYRCVSIDDTYYYHKQGGTTNASERQCEIILTSMWKYYQIHHPNLLKWVYSIRSLQYLLTGNKVAYRTLKKTYRAK